MQTYEQERFHSFRSDASALGGFLKEPFEKPIPSLVPVSLPAVGGFATARTGAFNLEEVVSCSSAYTLITGRESKSEESISTLATAVVEDFNLLEVVTATRIVAQIAVTLSKEGKRRISLAGSRIEGLRLAGRERVPILNPALSQPGSGNNGHELPLTWQSFLRAGQSQAENVVRWFAGRGGEASEWVTRRYAGTRGSAGEPTESAPVLCSLVDGFEGSQPEGSSGHIVEIPGFGRIILMELLVSRDSVQLVSVRAELGCPIKGGITGPSTSGGGGGTEN